MNAWNSMHKHTNWMHCSVLLCDRIAPCIQPTLMLFICCLFVIVLECCKHFIKMTCFTYHRARCPLRMDCFGRAMNPFTKIRCIDLAPFLFHSRVWSKCECNKQLHQSIRLEHVFHMWELCCVMASHIICTKIYAYQFHISKLKVDKIARRNEKKIKIWSALDSASWAEFYLLLRVASTFGEKCTFYHVSCTTYRVYLDYLVSLWSFAATAESLNTILWRERKNIIQRAVVHCMAKFFSHFLLHRISTALIADLLSVNVYHNSE